jgi:hypothetical protein
MAIRSSALLDMLTDRTTFCLDALSLPLPPWLDGPWFTTRAEREWQEVVEDNLGSCMAAEAMLK